MLAAIFTLWIVDPAVSASTSADAGGESFKNLAEGIGAAVGAVIALLGAPTVYLGIKKSQAEIRKLELETAKLQAEQGTGDVLQTGSGHETYNVVVEGRDNTVSITADPRLLGPLLLLLDFVRATILLTIAGYLFSFGGLSDLFAPLLAAAGVALFVPILREAKHLKQVLAPEPVADEIDESGTS